MFMKPLKTHYKTWIREKSLLLLSLLTLISLAGSLISFYSLIFLLFLIPTALFASVLLINSSQAVQLSPLGGDYQNRIYQLLIDKIDPSDSRILEIGCGDGNLAIKAAKGLPHSHITGLDLWQNKGHSSQYQCRTNARLEGVGLQLDLIEGSVSRLPFADASFDSVVSCLSFHELIEMKEALRVLSPRGHFVFFGFFLDSSHYSSSEELTYRVAQWGGVITEFCNLTNLLALPFPLRGKKTLGQAMLITGYKAEKAEPSLWIHPESDLEYHPFHHGLMRA